MKKINKNKKKTTILLIVIILVTILVGIFISKNIDKNKSYTSKMLNIVEGDLEYSLSEEEKLNYENKIKDELKESLEENKNYEDIKGSYYTLGVIKYLQQDNEESVKYLNEGIKYNLYEKSSKDIDNLNIKIYSALSSNFIQMGELEKSRSAFSQAKNIAYKSNNKNLLCDLYYARAKAKVEASHNINESIELMHKSLEYTDSKEHKVRNYLYLAKLYKLIQKYDLAIEYTVNALETSMKINDKVLINKCVINLGENYYIQKNYHKTIEIYENLIHAEILKDNTNLLTVYGYLAESYARTKDYMSYQKYREKYLEIANDISSNKDLVWIYAVCSELEINFSNIDLAKDYLKKAQNIYNKDKKDSYANMDILIDFSSSKIDYFENKDYKKFITSCDILLNKLDDRGVKSDVRDTILYEMLKLSFKEKDYEFFTKVVDKIHGEDVGLVSQTYTDSIFTNLNNTTKEKEINLSKLRILLLVIIIIVTLKSLINIRQKNTEINILNKQLKELNITDSLTNVYNRGYLTDRLKSLLYNNEEVSFVMIDIDYFKLYNDNYGHINGDNALIEVSKIIKEVFKDDMVFRYGGEEFSVLSNKSIEELIFYLDKLKLEIYNKNIIHEYSKVSDRITLSMGVSSSKIYTEEDILSMTKVADENLYKSKYNGRNQYTY